MDHRDRAAGQLSRLMYMDDSGTPDRDGLIIYGWVEVEPIHWRTTLRVWLELRKALWREFAVPVTAELHGTAFINGRGVKGGGHISANPPERYESSGGTVFWKDLGRDVAVRCLETLRSCEHLRVGAVYRKEPAGGSVYAAAKFATYGDFLMQLDNELRSADTYAAITMDGDDRHYRDAHRALKLDSRHVIEDPIMHDSKMSQWTQMADLVAYVANIHLDRYPGNEFGWHWYEDYLAPRDPHQFPQELQ